MLNIEKYKDEIKKLMVDDSVLPGVSKDGKLIPCIDEETCKDCKFETDDGLCSGDKEFIDWCLEDDGQKEDCIDCKHNGTITCNDCSHSHKSMFERKPKKTRQSEFLKMFPNAKFGEYDFGRALIIDPCDVNETLGKLTDYRDGDNDCERFIKYGDCGRCKDAYWNEEVE